MADKNFNRVLNIAAIPNHGFLTVENVSGVPVMQGADGKLITCIIDKLKFKYKVFPPPDLEWGAFKNGSWSGIIGMLDRGEADMGITYMAVTEERFQVVDFSAPYATLDRTFIVKAPGYMPQIAAYTYPFGKSVWISFILLMIVVTMLFQKTMFKNMSFVASFLAVLGSVLSHSIDDARYGQVSWKRIVFGVWLSIATVMPFLYNTSFLSFITVPERMPAINDFKDLSKEVLENRYRCFAPVGSIDLLLLQESKVNYVKELGDKMKKNNWIYDNYDDLDGLLDGRTALIVSRQLMDLWLGDLSYQDKALSDDSFGVWSVSIALGKHFCCKEIVDRTILGVRSGGLYEKWFSFQAFENNLEDYLKEKFEDREITLNLEDFKTAIFILLFGLTLAFLTFLGELWSVTQSYKNLVKRLRTKKKKMKSKFKIR
ncbi:lig_chan-Glu_bd domain-containing protein [Caerostris darwini]|uniref:Lig_chan-Glu_bd domain-containing protein n=1 Tax=Caerostris darwini TaxID=1538125 RepID=A0AAV4PZT1_9ARAC|nr:lig_chan-Glu_bd domain-containing protein [Caerostris darwini]